MRSAESQLLVVKCESGAITTPLCIGILTAATVTQPTSGGSGIQKAKQGFYITRTRAVGKSGDRSVSTGHTMWTLCDSAFVGEAF